MQITGQQKSKLTSWNWNLVTGISIGTGLLLFAVCFLHVFSISDSASAIPTATSSTMDMSVSLEPALEIWTTGYENGACTAASASRVDIVANPDEDVYTSDICPHVSTNASKGYTLTMSTKTAEPKLTHEKASVTATIDPLIGSGTSQSAWDASSAQNNMWGYDTDQADSFRAVAGSSSSNTLKTTSGPATDSTTDLTFGTKIDISQPSGLYGNTVILSAVVNVDTSAYMQDFTTTACDQLAQWGYNSATGEVIRGTTKVLWDERDNQAYGVRRLADGNCWMVENLNLSAESLTANGHSTTLDSSDTNLTSGATFTVPATSNANWGGESYAVAPKIATSNVPSYLDYGMYYNWWAATARTDNPTSGVAENSICPKNWNLPTGNANNQFHKMFFAHQAAYGFTTVWGIGNDMSKINRTNVLSGDTVGPNLQFSGYWHYSDTAPDSQSSRGLWWSSTVVNETTSYLASINSSGGVYGGMNNGNKRHGFSVRCMLPVGS